MHSWLVWLIVATAGVALGFTGYHFSVRTLRFVTAFFALAVVTAVTRYGVTHPGAGAHPDLVNSYTYGFDDLSQAFFRPFLGHNNPIPGRIGWLVIAGLLVFGYRELEVWAMCWQPPTVDLSALGGSQQGTQNGSKTDGQGEAATDQRHDEVVNELRFRLPAVAVKAPPILPGGTRVSGLISIAESTGNTVGGLAGAIINFAGTLWPNPRQYQVRVRVEPRDKRHVAGSVTVTVDLEDSATGESIATNTLPVRQLDEAACVVAGYVARQVFIADPTAPPWCYGSPDGSDLAALLSAWQDRVYPKSSDDVRRARTRQIEILERVASSSVCAGVTRYELAQLHDLDGSHVEALRLHAINREQYPRFYRGRYRLGMSLEMIANREFRLPYENKAKEALCESLRILDQCDVTRGAACLRDGITPGQPLPSKLRMALLDAAQEELCRVRRQLTLWRIILAAFVHRDERAIWKHYWRLAQRQRVHDGARVAELLVAVRRSLNENSGQGQIEPGTDQGPPTAPRDTDSRADQGQQQDHPGRVTYNVPIQVHVKAFNVRNQARVKELLARYNGRRAMNITAAITGDSRAIGAVLMPKLQAPEDIGNVKQGSHGRRTRFVPWQHSTPSWQAAYNTACLYAALAGTYDQDKMALVVVSSLERAISDRDNEMGRPSDWIQKDPDFSSVRSSDGFRNFLKRQRRRDYPL